MIVSTIVFTKTGLDKSKNIHQKPLKLEIDPSQLLRQLIMPETR